MKQCIWTKKIGTGRLRLSLFFIFLLIFLLLMCSTTLCSTSLYATEHNTEVSFEYMELIQNGDFLKDDSSWFIYGVGSGVRETILQNNGPALEMENITESNDPRSIVAQILHLPTKITAASYSFDFRLIQGSGHAGALELFLMKGTSFDDAIVMDLLFSSHWVYQTTDWISINNALNPEQVMALQEAHDRGELVFLVFIMWQMAPNHFKAVLDNVSIRAAGQMIYPSKRGLIAFIGHDDHGYPKTINTIKPDGSDTTNIWTHPAREGESSSIFDVSWRPDGKELAFTSDHEQFHSAFHSDVYSIKPDRTHLRRITNPPSRAELIVSDDPMGSITGKIKNNYGRVIHFFIYVQGALEPLSLDIGEYGDVVDFTIHNIVDLGDEYHYLVFMWSGFTACANGREFNSAVVDVVADKTIDIGTILFHGLCGTYHSTHITWKRDSQEIGVDVINPRRFDTNGETMGTDLFQDSLMARKTVWSPISDELLYCVLYSSAKGIYLTAVGGDEGIRLVNTGFSMSFTPAWLPDGSGFVYTIHNQLRQYLFSNQKDTLLFQFFNESIDHPSSSPCGEYIVFQRSNTKIPIYNNLWVIQRTKPNQLWPLTDNGRSVNPDWSSSLIQ